MPAQNEALERARALQDSNDGGRNQQQDQSQSQSQNRNTGGAQGRSTADPISGRDPVVVPTVAPIVRNDDGTVQIVMPDVSATIAAITARATDPNRNPNVHSNDRPGADRNGDRDPPSSTGSKRKSTRDRNNDHKTPTPTPRAGSDPDSLIPDIPDIGPAFGSNANSNGKDCQDPFAALPEDQRPKNWPFDNC